MGSVAFQLRFAALTSLFLCRAIIANAQTTKYEAETASFSGAGFSNAHSNFQGSGFVDFSGQGGWIDWSIPVAQDGTYDIGVRYAVDGEGRPLDLIVDGATVTSYDMLATPTWSDWRTETKTLSLSSGSRRIRLQATNSAGPNVDYISLKLVKLPGAPSLNSRPAAIALQSNSKSNKNEFASSPNNLYSIGIDDGGKFVIRAGDQPRWRADVTGSATKLAMQDDGNLVLSDVFDTPLWASNTQGNPGAVLVISNGGEAAVMLGDMVLYLIPPTLAFLVDGHRANVVMSPDAELGVGNFITSPNNVHSIGINSSGDLVFRSGTQTTWRVGVSGATQLSMQDDGNLVLYNSVDVPFWDSKTNGNPGAYLVITDGGNAAIMLGMEPIKFIIPSSAPTRPPAPSPTRPPTPQPTPQPTPSPTPAPVSSGPRDGPNLRDGFQFSVVLESNGNFREGEFMTSPNGRYRVGLLSGDLELWDGDTRLWSAGENGGTRLFMQTDGNLVLRNSSGQSLWTSRTGGNDGARFIVDDGGQIAVMLGTTALWLAGNPRGRYTGPSSGDLQFPIRTMFYYPWYPATWTVGGKLAHHEPLIGYYSSDDPTVVSDHIDQLDYAHTELSVASWFGEDTNSDRARLNQLMDETIRSGSTMKWTVYHEDEFDLKPSADSLKVDIDYLRDWFAWHPAWAHKDGKPIIFVYNRGACDVTERWAQANANKEWFVVLKVFEGYEDCADQPDSWHQYGPATDVINLSGVSFSISPGFWLANRESPRLPRVSEADWKQNVRDMAASSAPWHIITTFNEAGEGTMVESSVDWRSDTKYGYYLDALNEFP